MIPAYDETYLPDAMANLAGAFDYALNDCGLPVGLFMDFFDTSEAAALFGRGTPKYVCGMSGEELVAEIMRQTGWARILDMPPAALRAGSTPEYWAGWVLAYCQWARGVRFSDILDVLSLDDIVRLHPTLHEADESRFVDVYDERAAHNRTEGDSRLHTIRVHHNQSSHFSIQFNPGWPAAPALPCAPSKCTSSAAKTLAKLPSPPCSLWSARLAAASKICWSRKDAE